MLSFFWLKVFFNRPSCRKEIYWENKLIFIFSLSLSLALSIDFFPSIWNGQNFAQIFISEWIKSFYFWLDDKVTINQATNQLQASLLQWRLLGNHFCCDFWARQIIRFKKSLIIIESDSAVMITMVSYNECTTLTKGIILLTFLVLYGWFTTLIKAITKCMFTHYFTKHEILSSFIIYCNFG